jgi:MFS transporter, PAT family, beta-lactamase induction signal transducer AmpG
VTACGERMVPTTSISEEAAVAKPSWGQALGVYLRPRVLIVLFLGFSAGLPLALSGSTLLFWMSEAGVDLGTIGLFALVGLPYTVKFLWAPLVDVLDIPVLSRLLGRRRSWLVLTQLWLMAAIVFLGFCDPASSPGLIAAGAVMVATASATQDIVIDAFRIESLSENEQAAGMASYVAAYRVGTLASTAGALFLVSGAEGLGFAKQAAWTAGYAAMALLVLVGLVTVLVATEPEQSAIVRPPQARQLALRRMIIAALIMLATYQLLSWLVPGHEWLSSLVLLVVIVVLAIREFRDRDWGIAQLVAILVFVVLFKVTDALSGAMTPSFVHDLGFSRNEYAAVIKGVGLAATLLGGFAGGFLARASSLATCLWIGGIVQAAANLAFSWQATVGYDIAWLTFAIVVENFTSAVGTVIFVAYLSTLCSNPLKTATQYAVLTALAAIGRTFLAAGGGELAKATSWPAFFVICAAAAIPSLALLAWLQRSGHFTALAAKPSS